METPLTKDVYRTFYQAYRFTQLELSPHNRCLSTQIFYLAAAWDNSLHHLIKITAHLTKGKSPKRTCTVTVKTPPFRSTRSMFKCSTENSLVLTAEQCFLILCLCLLKLTWAKSQQESTISDSVFLKFIQRQLRSCRGLSHNPSFRPTHLRVLGISGVKI